MGNRKNHERRHRRSQHASRKKARARIPRSANEFRRKSAKQQDAWTKVTHVITTIRRDGVSLSHALRGSGVSRRTVLRLAASSLRKLPSGRWTTRTRDRLLRLVRVPAPDGMHDVALRDSKQASLVAKCWNAVHAYLAKGDASGLEQFANVRIKAADGTTVLLLTDRAALDRLAGAGVLSFESIYSGTV